MKFAICNEIYQGWPLDRLFAHAATAGYDAVEIAPFTLAPYVTDIPPARRVAVKETAQRAGLEISGIHWVLAQTEGLHLTHPDPGVRARTAIYLRQLVDFAADLGGRFMVVGSPKQRSLAPGVSPEQGAAWASDCFAGAVAQASERGVTICLEPLSPAETNFINTAREAIALVERSQSPHFKIILDVKAMCSENRPIPDIIRASHPHFAYFHANDRNLKGPGFGEVDFQPIVQALREVGYDGYVSVEVFDFAEGAEAIAERSLTYLRQVFG
jgi:sugar phosphate isomerase/epimerase